MKVLLILPPVRETASVFPVGFGYIARILKDAGHSVKILDLDANRWPREEIEKHIGKGDFDVAGIGGLITTYKDVKWITQVCREKRPDCKIIVGGGLPTSVPEIVLKHTEADIITIGEAERTIPELMGSLDNPKNVKGIWYKKEGKIIKNPPRPLIENLDEIPYPAWDLFDMETYLKNPMGFEPPGDIALDRVRSMPICPSRGCPYNCTFCYHIFSRRNRVRSAESILGEIKELKDRYDINFFAFHDDCFIINRKRLYEFCDAYGESGLGIKWACFGRANLMNGELLQKLKDANCEYVGYGIESGSQKMLDAMNKQVTVEQAKNALLLTQKMGIRVHCTFMVGIPGETRETIWETVKFCKDTNRSVHLFFAAPYPGTPLFEQAKKLGRIPDDLESYVSRLGDVDEFVVNLTDMPDEELQELRSRAEKEVNSYYRTPPQILKMTLNYWRNYGTRELIDFFRYYRKTRGYLG